MTRRRRRRKKRRRRRRGRSRRRKTCQESTTRQFRYSLGKINAIYPHRRGYFLQPTQRTGNSSPDKQNRLANYPSRVMHCVRHTQPYTWVDRVLQCSGIRSCLRQECGGPAHRQCQLAALPPLQSNPHTHAAWPRYAARPHMMASAALTRLIVYCALCMLRNIHSEVVVNYGRPKASKSTARCKFMSPSKHIYKRMHTVHASHHSSGAVRVEVAVLGCPS